MPPVQSTESPHRGSQSLFLGTAKGIVIWGSMAAQGMQASSRYREQESITLLHQALRVRLILQDSLSVTVLVMLKMQQSQKTELRSQTKSL